MICICIYKHPAMKISRFDSEYLKPILTNIQKEEKTCMLMGDFNVNLLSAETNTNISEFYINMSPHSLFLTSFNQQDWQKTQKTLIDNILLDEHNTLLDEHAPIHKLSKKGYPLRRNLGSAEAFNHLWENATNFWRLIVRKQTLQLS